MSENQQIIRELQAKASSVLDCLIPRDSTIVLLDYPNNTNVGDSLIWLGEMTYLRSRGIDPAYVSDTRNYDPEPIRRLINDPESGRVLILLNGGGNFGTLWPEIQFFRKRVLRDFPGVPVLQLPQSLHFEGQSELSETARLIDEHNAFTLLVRDIPSLELARKHFSCSVELCPDMAFFLGAVESNVQPSLARFILSRTDHEKKENWHQGLALRAGDVSHKVDDWLDCGIIERVLHRIEVHSGFVRRVLDKNNRWLLSLWMMLAKARMQRGIAKLQQGRVVITDRLHAHILSLLLNKRHVLIDNSNGKVGSFYRAWTFDFSLVCLVQDPEHAIAQANTLDTMSTQPNAGSEHE